MIPTSKDTTPASIANYLRSLSAQLATAASNYETLATGGALKSAGFLAEYLDGHQPEAYTLATAEADLQRIARELAKTTGVALVQPEADLYTGEEA